ncbi:VWA-like domain-containing protein [Ruminococcus sp. OA3]|uniref:vWA domain-containing protein n=1 Tax=Ruminococcus sp. OA3 TaxID=2914164 RepID=UPI001F05492C|nr:VWA-like domain-containing protein [Ruminococcus sp. OA3]MCH1980987.1 VWA-like domain-containing protein [Ruminococcus sp. OA3]
MNTSDELFLTTRQPMHKLSVAISRYFSEEPLTEELKRRYAAYILRHLYPALEWILKQKKVSFLVQLLNTGWLDSTTVSRGLKNRDIPTDMRLLLMRSLVPDASITDPGHTRVVASEILSIAQLRIFDQMPEMRLAIAGFTFQETADYEVTGTDGYTVYYSPTHVMTAFSQSEHTELYLHMLLHCLYLHLEVPSDANPSFWNLSCDISAWFLSEKKFKICGETRRQLHDNIYEQFPPEVSPALSLQVYEWLNRQSDHSFIDEWTELFKMDSHEYWYQSTCTAGRRFRPLPNFSRGFSVPVRRRFGLNPGSRLEELELWKEAKYDYRSYLRRFTVTAEEIQTDLESFDYIPYLYGLFRYGNLPLVEPLEYTEAAKVEELVIAIDTSGSCRLSTIQQFLAETCRILTDHQNFFRHMNVHIIQCDSMIQEHIRIRSTDDWNRYIQKIKISGRGGTDFTPVFNLVQRLMEHGEFRNLKGLLYFTDGDGVYPQDKPPYETAFIFTDYRFLNYKIPDWAVRLCLNLSEGEI